MAGIKPYSAILLMMHLCVFSHAQIVNIETERIKTDTTGWSGEAKLGFNYFSNVNSGFNLLEEGHLQFKTKKHLYLLKTSAIFSRVNGKDISNAAFIHLRHNVKLNRWLRFEQFAQLQNNPINKITLRGLLGGGPRFKLLQRKQMALYTASLIMYEYEKSIFPGNQLHEEHNLRWSAYVTTTIVFFQKLTLVHTTYYQPMVNRMKDFRINSETKIKLSITRHLSFEPGLRYMYESDPVPGIPPRQIFVENALKMNF